MCIRDRNGHLCREDSDPGFITVHQLLKNYLLEIDQGDRMIKPKEFIDMVESQQHGLNRMED
eukprot:7520420-Ditylum_brightwellii.AAC.1